MTDLGLDHLVSGPYRSTVPSTFSAYTTLFRSGLAERPGEALQVRMDRVLDDVGPDLLELGLQRRPDVGMVLEPVEEVEPGPVPGAQEHPLVPVGAHVVDRVVALGDLGVEIRAPGGAGQVAGGPVLHGVEAGAGPDRAGDRGAVQGGWVAVGRTGVGADGTEVAVVALSEREGAPAAHRRSGDRHTGAVGAEVRVDEGQHLVHDERDRKSTRLN